MAEAMVEDQDQYSCSICLDLMKDPVTIPCGHSYCMVCIGNYWDRDEMKRINCPQCRQNFVPRPVLNKNTMLAEIMENLRNSKAAPPAQKTADPEDIDCDFCSGNGVKAVKSCLECRASYCETHLQPHFDIPALKRHKLVSATNLPTCQKHDKLLEVYCRTDQKCICMMCLMDDHRGHDTVSCATEREEKEVEVKTIKKKIEEKCKEKEKELCELQKDIESHVSSAQQAVKDTKKAFKESISLIEKKCSEIIEVIRAQEKDDLDRLGDDREQLELDIAKLRAQGDVLDKFLQKGDVYFLQNCGKMPNPSDDEDCSAQSKDLINSFKNVSKTVSEFKDKLEVFCKQEADDIVNTVSDLATKTNLDLDPDFLFKIGDKVCVRSSVKTPKFNWGAHVTHKSIGVVKAVHGDTLFVNFPEHKNWKGDISELELVTNSTEQEASAQNNSIKVGDQVRVKPSVDTPKHKWGGITHQSVGTVKTIDGEALTVDFPEYSGWRGIVPEMEVVPADDQVSATNCSFNVGDKVRVKLTIVTPKHQWGGVTHRSTGTVTGTKDDLVTVDFPECKGWKGLLSEMELISITDSKACFKTGDRVKVNASVTNPKRGWGGASHKSVGVVVAVNGESITVDFPEHKSWNGTVSEMELVSGANSELCKFNCGDRVRVKSSVKTPKYNWGSISHKSVGTVKALKLVVDFPEQSNWSGDPKEMEVAP
uniref:FinTRIM family, member 79 n=1 Tax=Astyanax mexicanus TaxID=7994 RepID=A0A8B9H5F2_ASTMX